MAKEFEAIILDMGGVLYDIDAQRSVEAYKKLGMENFDSFFSFKHQTEFFHGVDTGKVDRARFVAYLRPHIPSPCEDEAILDAWRALLIGMPHENAELLIRLREKYRLFLLSNTNELHMEIINRVVHEQFGRPTLGDFFDKAYFSYQLGMRKPGVKIYQHVLKENQLDPQRTLFIDDNEDNIRGAQQAGIHVHLKPRSTPFSETVKLNNLL
jgi:glucose-1-phosphatase